jgi:DNA-binding transcriptional regulator YiaG
MKLQVRQLVKIQNQQQKAEPEVSPEVVDKLRFSAKGVRALRRKLKLSQADFAKLVDISDLAVYQWEKKEGKLALRQTTRTKLAEIRGFGRREALEQLGKGQKQRSLLSKLNKVPGDQPKNLWRNISKKF